MCALHRNYAKFNQTQELPTPAGLKCGETVEELACGRNVAKSCGGMESKDVKILIGSYSAGMGCFAKNHPGKRC